MARLRVGILSFAHVHADGYAAILRDHEAFDLVGFSEPDLGRGEAAAAAHGLRHFRSHESLLAEGLDAVVVCSENARRREPVELAAAHGCHVLCEKPIEATLEDALAMRGACLRAGVQFMTAFPMRFDGSVRLLREQVQNGDLGRVFAVNGINHSEIPRAHRAWFAERRLAGGGAVMDHTVHLVDLYRWIFEANVSEVFAEVGEPFGMGVDVDSAGLVTLTLEGGVFAGVDCSWSRPEGVYPRWGHLKLEVFGERGALEVDAFAQHLNVYSSRNARPSSWVNWGSDPNRSMLEAFAASIRGSRPPPVTWQDGFEALRVALACYDSAAAGQPVRLERT